MSNTPTEDRPKFTGPPHETGEQRVYVLPEHAVPFAASSGITLHELWAILWRAKLLIILVTALFAVGSVAYAITQTHWYRAEVLLAPADARSSPQLGGQLGGLAALAGVSVGGGESKESLAVLQSREFARAFVEEFGLLHVFFADNWDDELGRWHDSNPAKWPDIRDAVKYFHDNILSVRQDTQSGLVTLAIEWTDPETAAEWAAVITQRLNSRQRERASLEAETNIAYLQSELTRTSIVALQQSIGRLLEAELHKLMLARGNEEFAFRVIDSAEAPRIPSRPRRTLIAVLGTLLGGIVAVSGVLVHHTVNSSPKSVRGAG